MMTTIQPSFLVMMTLTSLSPLALAGSLEPPGPPDSMSSAMYSINDICERLKSGAEPELTPFGSPMSGPGASSRCTLNDVMAVAPKKDLASGAQASEVLSGKSYWSLQENSWGLQTGTMVNQGAQIYVPGVTDQAIAAGYHNGQGVVKGDADLIASNLKVGIEIFGVPGSYNPLVSTGDVHESEVLKGKIFSNEHGVDYTGTMPNQGAQTYTPSTQDQIIAAGYHNGQGVVKGDEDLKASNLLKGVELFGVIGNYECPPAAGCPSVAIGTAVASEVLAGKTFSNNQGTGLEGTMVAQGAKNYTPSVEDQPLAAGYYNGSGVVKGDANLVSSNIKSGVTLFGVAGDPKVVNTSSGNALPGEIVSGKKAWVGGTEVTGSLASQSLSATSTTLAAGIYAATTLEAIDSDLISSNIRKGVTIFGVSGDPNVVNTSSGDALASEVLTGKKAWVAGTEVTGTGQLATVPAPVPKTGQTISYVTGDDGDHKKGVTTSPRFTDNGDGTVTDNLTGLIWLKDANCFGKKSWSGALTSANNLSNGSCSLNDGSVVGEWRLPNTKELLSLIDRGQYDPALPLDHPFLIVQSFHYWSATTYASDTNRAWHVYLYDGDVYADNKTISTQNYVWPVRGGQ